MVFRPNSVSTGGKPEERKKFLKRVRVGKKYEIDS